MPTTKRPASKKPAKDTSPKRAPLRTWEDEGVEIDMNELPFGGRFGPPQPRDPIPGQPPLLAGEAGVETAIPAAPTSGKEPV